MLNNNSQGLVKVTLIDYGFSTSFMNQYNGLIHHIKDGQPVSNFEGNIFFASSKQLSFERTSRKDDLISLAYLLIYLLNNQDLPMFYAYSQRMEGLSLNE